MVGMADTAGVTVACRYCGNDLPDVSGMAHSACDAELVSRRDSGRCRACGGLKAAQDDWCGACSAKDTIVYENFPGGG